MPKYIQIIMSVWLYSLMLWFIPWMFVTFYLVEFSKWKGKLDKYFDITGRVIYYYFMSLLIFIMFILGQSLYNQSVNYFKEIIK